jgi:uncharacterized protein (UPF0333 family)
MVRSLKRESRGFAHLGMIILVVVVLAAIGGIGYVVMNKNKKSTSTSGVSAKDVNAAAKIAAQAECKEVDKDLCKFFTSWKLQSSYTMTSTDTQDGQTTKSTYQMSGGNYHMTTSGETSYEVIGIGDTTIYTKASDGTWWKQTLPKADAEKYKPSKDDTSFSDNQKDDAGQPITYTKIGKEACGSLTCFKYQENDPSSKDKQFIWFDDKDYQMRKSRTEGADGSVSEQTYSYDKVAIKAPSPSKDLGPNQVLIPGQAQPETLPSQADVQAQLNAALNSSTSTGDDSDQ